MHTTIRRLLFSAAGLSIVAATAAAAANLGGWSPLQSIESLPGSDNAVNTGSVDGCAALSPDGLTLFITSFRPGGVGGSDIWIAERSSTSEGFGAPYNPGAPLNSNVNDFCATMETGNRLYFSSSRQDPAGDLYVTRRHAGGWDTPRNLGPNINVPGRMEESASLFKDRAGKEVLVYSRRIAPPPGAEGVILYSVEGGPSFPVPGGPVSDASDNRPSVSKDGLTIYFDSNRAGLGGQDIWMATRTQTSDPFGTAIHLDGLSTEGFDARPFLSRDGSTLLVNTDGRGGDGMVDIFMSEQ